jgi:penicillin-binding protein 1A
MTAVYASFGNGGHRVQPHLIRRIETADGHLAWSRALPAGRVHALDPAVAFLVLDGLQGVVAEGTGWRVREHYRGPAGGKTGTTDEGRDAWFVGVTPEIAAGIWIGFDQPRTIVPGADAARLAVPAWGRWMAAVDEGGVPWRPPPGVERASVDGVTGRVMSANCPPDGVRVRRTWVRTSLRPVSDQAGCAVAPPNPSMLDLPRRERMRVLFRIPEPTRRDTVGRP